ncbi:MAG: phage holin family protein [Candidatus Bathyarchaeia archaeon]
MPEKETSNLFEKLARLVLREVLGGIAKPAERLAKRVARAVGLILAGLVISVLGIAFLAVGAVRWLAILMPAWLAWVLVGIILFLVGVTVTAVTYSTGRS